MTGIHHPQSSKESHHPTAEPPAASCSSSQPRNSGVNNSGSSPRVQPGPPAPPRPRSAPPPFPADLGPSRPVARRCGLGRRRPPRPQIVPLPDSGASTYRCMTSPRPPWHSEKQDRLRRGPQRHRRQNAQVLQVEVPLHPAPPHLCGQARGAPSTSPGGGWCHLEGPAHRACALGEQPR